MEGLEGAYATGYRLSREYSSTSHFERNPVSNETLGKMAVPLVTLALSTNPYLKTGSVLMDMAIGLAAESTIQYGMEKIGAGANYIDPAFTSVEFAAPNTKTGLAVKVGANIGKTLIDVNENKQTHELELKTPIGEDGNNKSVVSTIIDTGTNFFGLGAGESMLKSADNFINEANKVLEPVINRVNQVASTITSFLSNVTGFGIKENVQKKEEDINKK